MAVLAKRTVSRSGVALAPAAASGGGDSFQNDGTIFVYIKNGGGGSITATAAIPLLVDGVAIASGKQVTVGAGAEVLFGPFPTSTYNDVNGNVNLTYSGVTSVTVSAISSTAAG